MKAEPIIIASLITLTVLLNLFHHTPFYRIVMLALGLTFFVFCLTFAILNKYDKLI